MTVRWGLSVPFAGVPLSEHLELYRRAEALGYDDLWSGEAPNGPDGFTPLAAAAAVTQRLRLGTGIVNPFTRGPAVLAQSAAALQEASDGRFVLGIGSSSDVVVERFNGLAFERPLTRVRECVEALRPVLSVPAERGFGGLRLERPVTQPVPIVIAALRERMLGLAGSIADGAFSFLLPLSGVGQVAAAHRAGETAAGRPPGSTELICRFVVGESLDPFRGLFAAYASVPVYFAFFDWLGWGERIAPMVEAWASGDRARAVELVPTDLLAEIFPVGSPEQIRERLDAFVEAGVTTVVLAPGAGADGALLGALAR